ncbi:unnamed protein product [Periconia digitata]|uniref:Tcp11-domain-containing protein n=1 Tax=Periconia digitata TaxID=1303443 RepID=A0A9W4UMV2_9PLEO|nr:unnamed protein product [Periconia digitata]
MKARHSLKKSCEGYPGGAAMDAQTPNAAGSSVPFRPAGAYCSLPTADDVETMPGVLDTTTAWHPAESTSYDGEQQPIDKSTGIEREEPSSAAWTSHTAERAIPEQLADLLMEIIPGMDGAKLGEAFLCAADLPPVTKQSLGELDIQNIITNIKLRHDVNFDKDLSFRPNLDGPKGQEKRRHSDNYWRALVAEMELYTLLFQRAPSIQNVGEAKWTALVQHAQRRIPKVFRTLHEVLESLVPDRDHARVTEHFDVGMLMQEIERGVCDLVKRVEWVAILLKEHCAPMRDGLVDKMVQTTKTGVAKNDTGHIVNGLKELLGILEAMKLDVANHQIRNLKTLLIEDTVNFEKHYHLDRLVRGRSKVNIDAAHEWWTLIDQDSRTHLSAAKDVSHHRLETFSRAVVDHLFAQDSRKDLPDTFYLDRDRLWVLKLEIDDLVHFEICFDMFGQCLREFAYNGPISNTARSELRNALSAIIGETTGHAPESWIFHSESLSLEIYRQAIILAGKPFVCDSSELGRASDHLQNIFRHYVTPYASKVQAAVLAQVMACASSYANASPIELFNNLVTPPLSTSPVLAPTSPASLLQPTTNTLSYFADRVVDLSYRISHIILIHWRIWGPIAYITDDSNSPTSQYPNDGVAAAMENSTLQRFPPIPHRQLRNKPLSISTTSSSTPSSPHPLHGISAPTPPPTLHTKPPPMSTEIEPDSSKRGNSDMAGSELGENSSETQHDSSEGKRTPDS